MKLKYKLLNAKDVEKGMFLAFALERRGITLGNSIEDEDGTVGGEVIEFTAFSVFQVLNTIPNSLSKSITFEIVEIGKEASDVQPAILKMESKVYQVYEAVEVPQNLEPSPEVHTKKAEPTKSPPAKKVIKG